MKHGFVHTAHGRIHYMEAGQGAPVVLVPSNGCSVYEFEPAMRLLSGRCRPIAIDLPGHADSDPSSRHSSIEDYADAVVAFMDAMGLATASVGGSSLGGSVAVCLGARHGRRIDKLLVIEAPTRTEAEWADAWFEVETNFGAPTQTAEVLASRLFCPVTPELLIRWNVDRNKTGVQRMIGSMWAIRQFRVLDDAARITPPTLLIYGNKSPIAGSVSKLQSLRTDFAAVMVPEAGHFPMLDDPAFFAQAVADFVCG